MKNERCYECGDKKPDVRRVKDPLALSMNNQVRMRLLCVPCERVRKMDH